ncbi:amidase family protein [Hoeflea sp. AS60]|uniref:amidase family protein n=1 Tax=Hoeflea sp. AS60 TaxID=3135780 RepID=UPI00317C6686
MSEKMSATQSVNQALAKLEAHAGLNLVTELNDGSALAMAAELDASGEGAHGPLHGLPLIVKANIAVSGMRHDGACPPLRDNVAKADATVVQRLRDAGAIPVAIANMHELAFGTTSANAHFGSVGNPHDKTRMTGGSSGGTAAAIGAGIFKIGIGTDTGGSGRIPAAFCGCTGLRPTTGRYPGEGILKLTDTLDTISIMGSDMEHLAMLDAAIMSESAVEAGDVVRIRLAVVRDPFWLGINREMGALGKSVLTRLKTSGVTLVETDAPHIESLTEASGFPIALFETERNWQTSAMELAGLTLAEFADRIASPDVRGLYQQMARGEMPGEDAYRAAMDQHRPDLQKAFADLFEQTGADALIFPTLARSAPPIGETEMIDIDGDSLPLFPTMTRRELPASIAGLPALTLPAGLCADGLPFAMELVGPSRSDRALLAIGRAIEALLN